MTVYDPARAYDGYTLYTTGGGQNAFLVGMDGKLLHEWHLPFSAVWDKTAAVKDPQPDSHIYWEKAYVYPNGDLLAINVAVGDSPWGYGLVKVDKDSKLIWKYLQHTHHSFDVGSDGKIYALIHDLRFDVIKGYEHLAPPRIDDYVAILSPDGKELKRIWVLGAVVNSPYERLLSTVPWYISRGEGDFLHTNSIQLVEGDAARNMPFAKEGQLLLSFREIGTVAVLDPEKEQIVWGLRGSWLGQHDAEILPNGHLLLFDNNGHYVQKEKGVVPAALVSRDGKPLEGAGTSRVIEIDPSNEEIVWRYAGDLKHPFESKVRSAEQRLPNGNTLITESDGGRLLEVTPDGDIVWEFINPERGGEAGNLVPITSWGHRFDRDYFDPGFLEP
ncbi:MAG: arylsulfotransferase family protein [Geminicoccaceae bacterium]